MSKQIIPEVAILRPLALFLVMLGHCLAPFAGFWDKIPSEGGQNISLYWWLGQFIVKFHVELFIFISGYIFAYQSIDLARVSKFKDFVLSKLKRLYLPCLIFGVAYYFCFYNQGGFDLSTFLLKVTSGCGHLWFLPVLFWCFVVGWFLNKYKVNHFISLGILAFISILPIPFMPLGMSNALHYLFYFYLGYVGWVYRSVVLKYIKGSYILGTLILYLFLVVFYQYIDSFIANKYLLFGTRVGVDFLIAVFGIIFSYLLVCYYTSKPNFELSPKIFYLSSVCYGIYVYHQFLLEYLYYYTSFPSLVGDILLPWLSLVIVVLISYFLTVLSLKTKVGRFLIG